MLSNLTRRIPITRQFSQYSQHSCRFFLFFCENSSLSLTLCLITDQASDVWTNTYLRLYSPFLFVECFTREDVNIHMTIACKFLSNNICTIVEDWYHDYFWLEYFSSSTHIGLVTRMTQNVWRHCVLIFYARSLLSCRKNTFSSFNIFFSLTIFDYWSCFNSPVSDVKVS